MKLYYVLLNHLFSILFQSASASSHAHQGESLALPYRGICVLLFVCLKQLGLTFCILSSTEVTLALSRISSFLIVSLLIYPSIHFIIFSFFLKRKVNVFWFSSLFFSPFHKELFFKLQVLWILILKNAFLLPMSL